VTLIRLRNLIVRHRSSIKGLSLIVIGTLITLYCVYKVDVFTEQGGPVRAETIELDEALSVSALVFLSLLTFGACQYLAQKREVARRIAAERHARELAYQDGLTALPNRRQYDEALKAALASPPRADAFHGVFLLDLNGFKQINDVYGHGVGDEVLVLVGQRLRSAMRDGDVVARFGGDEFAILALHLGGPEAATNVALRVIESLSTPISTGRASHCVGVGIGIALVPTDATDAETALRKADVALYRAKAERRSALRFFEPEMDVRVQGRTAMEAALRAAYSSLYHLRNLKIDKLKIDRSFVLAMQSEKPSAEIVAALVGLGHGLGLTIVADGIEASDQEASVLRSGCDEGQGHHFSASLLAAETERLFHTGTPLPRYAAEGSLTG